MEPNLNNTISMLKECKHFLENHGPHPTHLSNLPGWFWETLGEAINDVEFINEKLKELNNAR